MGEWKEYKLNEVYDFSSGLSKSREEFGFGYGFLSYMDVFDNYFVPDVLKSLVNSTQEERKYCSIRRGDVFLTRTSETDEDLGMSSVALKDYPEATFNGFTKRLRPNGTKEILPEYAGFYFRSPRFRAAVGGMSSMTTRASLNNDMLSLLSIFFPPIEIQTEIVDVLYSLHKKIDLLHRQNKILEQMTETIFRRWFIEKAEEGQIGEYVKIQGGYAFKSEHFKNFGYAGIIKITNISMGLIDIENTQYVSEEVVRDIDEEKFRIKSGEFLIAMTGAEVGKIGIVEETSKSIWLNQRVGRLIPKVPYGDFIGYLAYKSREGQDYIENTASGSAQDNISTSELEKMEFPNYSKNKTDAFGKEVESLFDKIIFNYQQIRTLTQLRDTLLPKLMSGEVKVKE